MELKFRVFKYHGNFWVYFPIAVILMVLWFLVCYGLVYTFFDIQYAYHIFVPLFTGFYLINIGLAKFRYRNKGFIYFGQKGIKLTQGASKFLSYDAVGNIAVYYCYNNYRIENWGRLGGFHRYHNLTFRHKISEASLDKIVIDDEQYYIKIRSYQEAKRFEEMIDLVNSKVNNLTLYYTNTTRLMMTMLFGS